MYNKQQILSDMSELWKVIFHDSDSYIELVISDSLDLELCEWNYNEEGIMTSMIIGVLYTFIGQGREFKGLYLCGVSTRQSCRGRGEIQRLMSSIEYKALARHLDFTFLIPANEKLRKFYEKYSYESMSPRTKNNIYCGVVNGILKDDLCMFSTSDSCSHLYRLSTISEELIDNIPYEIFEQLEKRNARYNLVHTRDQWVKIFKDWIESGNEIYGLFHRQNESRLMQADLFDESHFKGDMFICGILLKKSDATADDNRNLLNPETGMMKRLRDDLPASDEFAISFMMD